MSELSVLVVEDNPTERAAHAQYIGRIPGLRLAGEAGTAARAMRCLTAPNAGIDLVLLDLHLPDAHGLDLCRSLRGRGIDVDVIVITAARDLATVRASVSLGVVHYLIKPFTFATFADRIRAVAEFRRSVTGPAPVVSQHDVDEALRVLRVPTVAPTLAKGLVPETLTVVAGVLRVSEVPMSANEVAEVTRTSRVTARRYLEHLVATGQVTRTPRYGTPGRPELEFRWAGREG